MEFKIKYLFILFACSIFYLVCGVLDFIITMSGYINFGYRFFEMEFNPIICFFLKSNIIPIYMFVIPLVIVLLSVYLLVIFKKVNVKELTKIADKTIFGIWFVSMLVAMMGFLHLIGFISWFYFGAF